MEDPIKQNLNPWDEIPLEDYENHMANKLVGQLVVLNLLTKKYLDLIKPKSTVFLGVAGGNGLEHIDPKITSEVVGIDINQQYLDETFRRYSDKLSTLKVVQWDITRSERCICKTDLMWAALVLEYTGIERGLEFSKNNLTVGGHLVVTIQANNNVQTVSPTGIQSVQKAGSIFKLVDPEILVFRASSSGFSLLDDEENFLPNGKSFKTFHFVLGK